MAKKKDTEDESVIEQGTQVETNAGVRGDIMRNVFAGLHQLDAQIEALEVKHIEPVKRARTKDRKKLCADLNMKWADIKPLYDLEKRAIAAREMEDTDMGDMVLTNIQEAMNYLVRGETLDFLDVLEATEQQETAPAYLGENSGDADAFEDDKSGKEKVQQATAH